VLGLTLDRVELSFRILRPIYRKSVAYKPFGEVSLTDRTRCDRAPILIQRDRAAAHGPSGNEGVEIVRGLRSAPILQAVFSPAKLAALWSVDAPQPYSRPVNFQGVAVDDAGLPGQIAGRAGGWRHKDQRRKHDQPLYEVYANADGRDLGSISGQRHHFRSRDGRSASGTDPKAVADDPRNPYLVASQPSARVQTGVTLVPCV
jgi:hypothetical protein